MPLPQLTLLCPILIVAGGLVSCDNPQKRALRELGKIGVQPSGLALLQAVQERDPQRTGWLLDVGVFTEQHDEQGRTPMRVALENGDLSSVFRLMAAKANVNATTPDQVSILGKAVENGETAVVEKLLEAGAQPDGQMPDGDKILPWAIRNGRMSFVRAMMKAGADPHLKDRWGSPLLHVAMETKRRDLTDSLVELGADATATNAAGETTAQLAVRNGWIDALPKLAKAGADLDAPCTDGSTLMERAIRNGNRSQVALFLKLGANANRPPTGGKGRTPLEQAFFSKDRELFALFLDSGAKPAGGSWDPWLWKTFRKRDLERARILLAHGAKAGKPGPRGYSLLETAVLANEGSFVKLLTDYGQPTGRGLYLASARGNRDMAALLITCGAPVNHTPVPMLDTALGAAIRGKHDELAAMLLQSSADPTLRVPEAQPALHFAIATGCHRTVKELLEQGMDPNAPFILPINEAYRAAVRPGVMRWVLKNDRNATPLMLAADSGVVQSARHLIRAGAKMQVKTKNTSLWPINFASRRSDVKMMRLFLGKDPLNEERRIVVRISEQRALMYDSQGNEIFTTKVSTGKKGHDTPTGEYVITNKYREWKSTLYHASMPYFQRLNCGDFGLHQGVVPGYPASHGCIRVPAGVAEKLFAMTQAGDRVNIVP